MLYSVAQLSKIKGTLISNNHCIDYSYCGVLFSFILSLMIFVKFPIFLLHSWLPKVHVEAPTEGSVLLAGVIMKCGGYGISLLLIVLSHAVYIMSIPIRVVGVIGLLFIPVICIILVDSKKVVAYSSIVHISIPIISMVSLIPSSVSAVVIVLFAHGLVSPLMFIYAGEKKPFLGGAISK